MRRRTYLTSLGLASVGLAGCNSITEMVRTSTPSPTGSSETPTDGESTGSGVGGAPDAEEYFVLDTATHNDVAGEYYIDAIARDGQVVESFESGDDAISVAQLDETQSFDISTAVARDGSQSLHYAYGTQDARDASNSQGILYRPMTVVGADDLSVWARQDQQPEDDIHLGWGYAEDGHDFAIAFDLNRETTGRVTVRTNHDDGTDYDMGLVADASWLKYEFAAIDWDAGIALARVVSPQGEELASSSVSFTSPA